MIDQYRLRESEEGDREGKARQPRNRKVAASARRAQRGERRERREEERSKNVTEQVRGVRRTSAFCLHGLSEYLGWCDGERELGGCCTRVIGC